MPDTDEFTDVVFKPLVAVCILEQTCTSDYLPSIFYICSALFIDSLCFSLCLERYSAAYARVFSMEFESKKVQKALINGKYLPITF